MPPEPEPLLIRGARLLDSTDPVDVHLADGRVAAIGDRPTPPSAKPSPQAPTCSAEPPT
ncbi:hypothetical protein [Actinomadura sp. 6K520]|uniref:hypothetical protein n=1 Tax=Actinomadura sp. 6K520 TaxID=2530364 RepID=UPI001404D06B|nr:hypothetical protein [Actinomadura sp. 6K520]